MAYEATKSTYKSTSGLENGLQPSTSTTIAPCTNEARHAGAPGTLRSPLPPPPLPPSPSDATVCDFKNGLRNNGLPCDFVRSGQRNFCCCDAVDDVRSDNELLLAFDVEPLRPPTPPMLAPDDGRPPPNRPPVGLCATISKEELALAF